MSRVRHPFRGFRLPPAAALIALGALLCCSQFAASAHAEVDCEHDSCGLCIGSAGDSSLVNDPPLRVVPSCKRKAEPAVSSGARSVSPPMALVIRGPPAT